MKVEPGWLIKVTSKKDTNDWGRTFGDDHFWRRGETVLFVIRQLGIAMYECLDDEGTPRTLSEYEIESMTRASDGGLVTTAKVFDLEGNEIKNPRKIG